jgi:hypothetical protein
MANSISQNSEMAGYQWNEALSAKDNITTHFTNLCQAFHEIVTTIPTTIPTSKRSSNNIKTLLEDPNVSLEDCPFKTKKTKKPMTLTDKEMLLANNDHELPEQMIDDYVLMRKKQKKPITFTGWSKINKTLQEIQNKLRIEPTTAFETMIEASWARLDISFFQDKEAKKSKDDPNNLKNKAWS